MNPKMKSAIEKITLNDATFSNEVIEPTYVNFFYGKNGAGKSTIARTFKANDERLQWQAGKASTDYDVLVYDTDFINANLRNYGNLAGVFTVNETNIAIQEQVDTLNAERKKMGEEYNGHKAAIDQKTADKNTALSTFQSDCWSKSAEARTLFDEAIKGKKKAALFAQEILAITPVAHDVEDLKTLYGTVFSGDAQQYNMLSTSYNFIKRYNPTADVRLFGQEINPESYAICLAEMLIKGQNAENICYQDTMKKDRFAETKMRFVIENPPFGTPWGGKDAAEGVEKAVNDEYAKGFEGRWGAGLPGSGDMQMLFLQSAIDKMDDNFGRAAIIENGSPLFSGGTASGESQIRRWMLENDLIEAIIALPTDLFYNTGIATYIWVLSKNKRAERKGKIQLIDASSFFHKLRKALGDKKNEISPEDRSTVTKLYAEFAENEYCKIYDNEEFIYREYTVMQPLQRSYAITEERIEAMLSKGALSSLYDQAKVNELENAEELTGKEQKKLESFQNNQALYDEIITTYCTYY